MADDIDDIDERMERCHEELVSSVRFRHGLGESDFIPPELFMAELMDYFLCSAAGIAGVCISVSKDRNILEMAFDRLGRDLNDILKDGLKALDDG